jgi:hypothetical protein
VNNYRKFFSFEKYSFGVKCNKVRRSRVRFTLEASDSHFVKFYRIYVLQKGLNKKKYTKNPTGVFC